MESIVLQREATSSLASDVQRARVLIMRTLVKEDQGISLEELESSMYVDEPFLSRVLESMIAAGEVATKSLTHVVRSDDDKYILTRDGWDAYTEVLRSLYEFPE